jgi:hypothetical protein
MSDLPAFLAPVLEDVRPPCRNGTFAPTDGLPSSPSTAGLAPLIDRPPPARPPCGRRPAGDPLPAPGRRRTAGKGRAQADRRPLRLAPGRCRHVGFVAAAQGAQLACQKTRRVASRADDPADLGNLLSRLAPDAARRSSATGPTRPAPHAWCVAFYPQGGEPSETCLRSIAEAPQPRLRPHRAAPVDEVETTAAELSATFLVIQGLALVHPPTKALVGGTRSSMEVRPLEES